MTSQVFRWIEFVFGLVKLTLALCIIIIMNVMNPDVGANTTPDAGTIAPREVIFHSSNGEYGGWFASISASVFLASFSILGIEIVAATAQEANFETTPPKTRRRPTLEDGNNEMMSIGVGSHRRRSSMTSLDHHHPHHHHDHHNPTTRGSTSSTSSLPHYDPNEDPPIFTGSTTNATKTTIVNRKDPFGYAMWIPTTVTVVYVWGGWIVSQNIRWDDERLPTLEWGAAVPKGASISPFINSAADSGFSKHLPKTLTSLLVLHVISTSSSVLYVAARTLFGFAYTTSNRLAGHRRTWRYRVASWLAAKNKFDVPYVAVLVSAWLFWLPFLKYTSRRSFNSAVNVITEMASVACVLVWALESLAAFNFYRCYKRFHLSVRQDIKSVAKVDDTSWYYSHLIISMLSVILCLGIVFIGGTMTLLLNLDPLQGVAAFSIVSRLSPLDPFSFAYSASTDNSDLRLLLPDTRPQVRQGRQKGPPLLGYSS
jgi:amino acid permease